MSPACRTAPIVVSILGALAGPAIGGPAPAGDDRCIVRPRSLAEFRALGLSDGEATRRAARAAARVGPSALRRLDAIGCLVVRVPPGEPAAAYADRLMRSGDYRFVEIDRPIPAAIAPDDPLYPSQWHLTTIGAPTAWALVAGAPEIVIAIADSGIDLDHPDLAPLLVPGYNAVDDLAQADGGLVDGLTDHGTEVAGCVGAVTDNAFGIAGLCPNARLMPIRVSNEANDMALISDINAGAIWAAEHGATVVNASFSNVTSPSVALTGEYLASLGAHFVWAAGNAASSLGSDDPAHVTVVGATTVADALAAFSNTGAAVDLVAPGVSIQTTKIDGFAAPNGTSFASPIVSGVLAMVRSMNPALTTVAAEYVVTSTAADLGEPGEDLSFGAGRVDAAAAVALAAHGARRPLAPIAIDDSLWMLKAGEPIVLSPLANDLDLNGDAFGLTAFDASAAHGLVTEKGDGTSELLYEPDECFEGFASVGYTIADVGGLTDSATIAIGVAAPPQFDAGTLYTTPGFGVPNRIEAADIDLDGDADMLAVYTDVLKTITVWRNDGGTFVNGGSIAASLFSAVTISVADLVGDDCPDIVVVEPLANRLTVIPGSCGSFASPIVSTVTQPGAVVARTIDGQDFDANGDGVGDVAFAATGFPTALNVLLGNGDGTFTPAGTLAVLPQPNYLELADLTGDGIVDLVSLGAGGGELRVVTITSAGGLVAHSTTTSTGTPGDLAIADVNGDGALDAVVASTGALGSLTGFVVHLNDGSGQLLPPTAFTAAGSFPEGLGVADFDGDGDADLALAQLLSNDVALFPGLDSGAGDLIVPVSLPLATGTGPQDIAILDADGDGAPDIAALVHGGGSRHVRVFRSRAGGSASGDLNGDGTVGPQDLAVLLGAWGTAGADLDGDGVTGPEDLTILLGAWGGCG